MINAKQAKEGTKIERYMKERCMEIEQSILLSMDLGLSYTRINSSLPKSIQDMLVELGYTILEQEAYGTKIYIITWADAKEVMKCN